MMHEWLRMTQQIVDVIEDPVSGRYYTVDRIGEPIEEVIGCNNCAIPLISEQANQPCIPIDSSAPIL